MEKLKKGQVIRYTPPKGYGGYLGVIISIKKMVRVRLHSYNGSELRKPLYKYVSINSLV